MDSVSPRLPTEAPMPETIGRYRLLRHLKAGGMANVYKAENIETGLVVALKVLSTESAEHPKRLERFRREAKHGARLRHENIVTLYEFGEGAGTLYMALEYVDGIDLEELIRRHGPLGTDDALQIVTQIARALDYAHRMEMVHRDIKPSNILITQKRGKCIAKLADLGLARGGIGAESRVTSDGSTVGTVDYMPPEQAKDSGAADIRSDLYALGCTLYHMLSGAPPFAEGSIVERLVKHAKAEPADLRGTHPQVSEDLWAICRRLLAKKPDQRYQTPADLLIDLAHAMAPLRDPDAAPTRITKVDRGSTRLAGQSDDTPVPNVQSILPLLDRLSVDGVGTEEIVVRTDGNRIAQAQCERGNQAIATGNYDYGMMLILTACRLEPGSVIFHQALRQAQRTRQDAPEVRTWRSGPIQWWLRIRMYFARRTKKPLRVLECGRQLLTCNPDDLGVQLEMVHAALQLGFTDLALCILEAANATYPEHVQIARDLAELLEQQGEIDRALSLWEMVADADSTDRVAHNKTRDLAAEVTRKTYGSGKNKPPAAGSAVL